MGIAAERQPGSDWPKQSHDDHIKLASIADRRMWDQFNQQNLVYTFTGPNMTTSTKLWHANSVFFVISNNPCSADMISQSTRYYRKHCLTAVLRACATTLPSRLSTVIDPSPAISLARDSFRATPDTVACDRLNADPLLFFLPLA